MKKKITFFTLLFLFTINFSAQNWDQIIKTSASDAAPVDFFGYSVAISGDIAIVGSPRDDDSGRDSGAAYIFTKIEGNWSQTAKLIASDASASANFGSSVAIDGITVVIGAPRENLNGQAYIFRLSGGQWAESQRLRPSSSNNRRANFGGAVAIYRGTVFVGAEDFFINGDPRRPEGAAYIFKINRGQWIQSQILVPKNPISERGTIGVGSFGSSIAISRYTVIIGDKDLSNKEVKGGGAYIFNYGKDGVWTQAQRLTPLVQRTRGEFGASVALDGNTAVIGAKRSSAAYIFNKINGDWIEAQELRASDIVSGDEFGGNVGIHNNNIIVGASKGEGAAYIFTNTGDDWIETKKITVSGGSINDNFGRSVAISSNAAIVGANNSDNSGAAYFLGGVVVADTTPPTIDLTGNTTETIAVGATYTDAGATANDDTDGDITNNITVVSTVDVSTVGVYKVTYNVKDAADNPATEVTRTVNVEVINNPYFTLADNDVTCLCTDAEEGEQGTLTINSVQKTFTKRSEAQLRALIAANQNDPQIALTCTSGITDMFRMFHSKGEFNQDIGSWDVSNVTDMSEMFNNAQAFNKELGNWDVSKVINMSNMFSVAQAFNQEIGSWDVSKVINMQAMFYFASNFNQDIGSWDVSNVTDMSVMFNNAQAFNKELGNWDVSKVLNMSEMFIVAQAFNQEIGSWDVSNVESMDGMFLYAEAFNQNLSNWCVSHLLYVPTDFSDNSSWQTGNQPDWGNCPIVDTTPPTITEAITPITAVKEGFTAQIADFDADETITWSITENIGLAINTDGQVTITGGAVFGTTYQYIVTATDTANNASHIEEVSVTVNTNPNFTLADNDVTCLCTDAVVGETGTVEVSTGVFKTFTKRDRQGIRDLLSVDGNNDQLALTCTSGITDMSDLFRENPTFNQEIGSWDVSNVTDMFLMFGYTEAFNQDIGSWDVSNVIQMQGMFDNAQAFNQEIGSWDVSNVTDMTEMFSFCVFNQDIGSWDVSKVAIMRGMFNSTQAFNQDLTSWCVSQIGSEPTNFSLNSVLEAGNQPIWEVGNRVSASSVQVGSAIVFTIIAPTGVTVTYSGAASGTAVNGDLVTIGQSVLTSGSASIVLESAALTSGSSCSTTLGGAPYTYSEDYCNAPSAVDISVSSAQVSTDVVFTINAPAGVTVTYSGAASGTAVDGDLVTIGQSVLTSGSASIILESAALTSGSSCSTTLGGLPNTYSEDYCNAPSAEDISVSSVQLDTDVVYTIIAPAGVTVAYSGAASGTAINVDIVTVSQAVLTSGIATIIVDSAYLTTDNTCTTALGVAYEQAFCNGPVLTDVNLTPSVSGDDIIFTVNAAANVTAEITSVQGAITAVDGDVITFVDGNLIHSIVFSATITGAYLTDDNSCLTDFDPDQEISFTVPRSRHPFAVDDEHTLDQTKSRSIKPLTRGANDNDPNNLTLRIKTINGEVLTGAEQTINVTNGVLTIDDENRIWFKSDNAFTGLAQFPYEIINTDGYQDDGVVFVTVEELPNQPTTPTAVSDFYTMKQGTTLDIAPLKKGTDDNDPNNLELVITVIDNTTISGVGQTITVTDGELEVLDAELSELSFRPNPSFTGTTTFNYTLTSLIGDIASATVTIVVDPVKIANGMPNATDDNYIMDYGTLLKLRPLKKGEDDSDPNDLDLSIVSINSIPLVGGVQTIPVPNGLVSVDIDEEITFTPDALFAYGEIMFPYTITNTINETDSGVQHITVNAFTVQNGGPTAINDSYTMDQEETIEIRPLKKGIDDSDPENKDLFIYAIAGEEVDYSNLPQNIDVVMGSQTVGFVTFTNENEITFTGASAVSGSISFSYVIVNEVITLTTVPTAINSSSANQVIEIIPSVPGSDNPVAVNDSYTINQGETLEIRPLKKGVDDSDPADLDLTIYSIAGEEVDYNALPQTILVNLAGNLVGTVVVESEEILFIPSASTTGTVTFPYMIKNTISKSATANQIIEVNPIQSLGGPTATNDGYTINQEESLEIRPLKKGIDDSDPGDLDLTVFSIAGEEVNYNSLPQTIVVNLANTVVGTVIVESDEFLFTPSAGITGTVTFPYMIKNTIGESATANQIIEIVSGVKSEDSPRALDDTYTLKQGSTELIKPLTKHNDDYDPNDLTLRITHLGGEEVDGGAQDIEIPNAIISIDADDVITFIPDPSFYGTITFPYIIANTNNETATGLVNMIVDAVSMDASAPNAVDDFYIIPINTAQKIAPLTYGTSDTDPNGERLSLAYINGEEVYGNNQIIAVPNGKLQINGEDDITFIPNTDYLGFAMFSYEISNAKGISDTGLQTIEVVEATALSTDEFVLSVSDFIVYPNPSQGDVHVRFNSNLNANANITLSDITGKTIYNSKTDLKQGDNQLDFNFTVSPGVMFLRITSNNKSVTKKLVFK